MYPTQICLITSVFSINFQKLQTLFKVQSIYQTLSEAKSYLAYLLQLTLIMPVKDIALNFGGCALVLVKHQDGKHIIGDVLTFTLVKGCKELVLFL